MGDPSFLPASPHIVPTAWTCFCVTHRVNGLVMGLQRLLMKRRFCLHTRATRHFADNSDCGSSAIANLPRHSASASRFSPASVQITQKRRRWGLILAGRCVALADWQSSHSTELLLYWAEPCHCLLLSGCTASVERPLWFFTVGANLFHVLVRHTSVPLPSTAAHNPS